jgi:hypothetical protein
LITLAYKQASADPNIAAEVLREVLALPPVLAGPDFTSPGPAQAAIAGLITAAPPQGPESIPNGWRGVTYQGPATVNGVSPPAHRAAGSSKSPPLGSPDDHLLADAASRIVSDARQEGEKLSQAVLADVCARKVSRSPTSGCAGSPDISGLSNGRDSR